MYLVIAALFAAGCSGTHSGLGENPALFDSSTPEPHGDSGPRAPADGGLDASEDSGREGGLDASVPSDAGGPSDGGRDAMADADASDDAGEDASSAMCTDPQPPTILLGTPEQPYLIAASAGELASLNEWRGRSFIRFTGVTPGARYTVVVSSEGELGLGVFDDDQTFQDASCLALVDPEREHRAVCDVVATRDTIDVTLDSLHKGEAYYLELVPAFVAQGTAAAPVPIAIADDTTYDGVASTVAPSFYEITGLTSGVAYDVSVQGHQDAVELSVFDNAQLTGEYDAQTGWYPHAFAVATGTSLFVRLRARTAGTRAEIDVVPAVGQGQGTPEAPFELTAPYPAHGEIGWRYSHSPHAPAPHEPGSFYVLTGIEPGTHVVSLSAPLGVVLYVLGDDPEYTADACGARVGIDGWAACSTRIAGDQIYVYVVNEGGPGGAIELSVSDAPHVSLGTDGAVVEIPFEDFPAQIHVEEGIGSRYVFTGLTEGQTYLFRPEAFGSRAVRVELFASATSGSALCTIEPQDNTGRQCNVTASRTSLYAQIEVAGLVDPNELIASAIGTSAVLTLTPIVVRSEGTSTKPIVLDCPDGAIVGTLGTNRVSYYELSDLEASTPYLIEAYSGDYLTLQVFSGAGSTHSAGERCDAWGAGPRPAHCVLTTQSTRLYVRLEGFAAGSSVQLRVIPLESSSEGAIGNPVSLDLSTGSASYSGRVSPDRPSYYELAELQADTAYILRFAPVHEPINPYLFYTSLFDEPHLSVHVAPGAPFEVVVLASPAAGYHASTYFTVEAAYGVGTSSDVQLDVIESPIQSEGTITPVALTLGDLPRAGQVDAGRPSRYQISGLTPGASYEVLTESASINAMFLAVYEGGAQLGMSCAHRAMNNLRTCMFTPSSTSVELHQFAQDTLHATFTLDVQLHD